MVSWGCTSLLPLWQFACCVLLKCLLLFHSRELLPPHIGRCQSSATSIFQPPPSRRTTTSSQHAWPSGVLRRRSDGLECAAWWPSRPVAQCRQFQKDAKDAFVSECIWTLSALEALCNALYKFKTYLLTYNTMQSSPRMPHYTLHSLHQSIRPSVP